jgi:ABC-type spermidine/putrescine transport system permease subunit II
MVRSAAGDAVMTARPSVGRPAVRLTNIRKSFGDVVAADGVDLEASADLGAHGFQTFRFVTLPTLSTAIIAGALLAFALSFDEVIVTTFTAGAQNTLPLWIFGEIRTGQQLPEVNAFVVFVLALTIIPVAIAVRLTGGGGVTRSSVRDARDSD